MSRRIWLSPSHLSGQEKKYIYDAFDANWIAPLGPNVGEFENSLQQYIAKEKYCTALNSGTSAIHLALILAGVSKGDTVLCQSFTFCASANPILYVGAKPVFVDSERDTWNMCPQLLEKAIQERLALGKKPKAMIAVNGYGMPYKVDEIQALSEKYEIPIIEDAAGALGSSVNKQKCGSFGDYGVISFNGNKIITTSSGGVLICKDKETQQKAIFLGTQAKDNEVHYQHSELGYNYRMTNIIAGIGRGQLAVLDERVHARRANFEFYKRELAHISEIQFLEEPVGFFSNRWLTCMLTPSFEMREQIRLALESENIESRPLWKPMHQQPLFSKYESYTNGVSEELFKRGLCLPSGSNLTNAELLRIVNCIKNTFE